MARFGRCLPCGFDWSFGRSVKLTDAHCPDCGDSLSIRRKADPWPLRFGVEIRPAGVLRVGEGLAELRLLYRPKKVQDYELKKRESVRSPEDIANHYSPRLRDLPVESFWAMYLDGRHNVIHEQEVAVGTPTQCVPHVRDIITPALWCDVPASGIVMAHNHPSGNTTPSREDKRFTQTVNDVCEGLGMKLVDHIVIGMDCFFSFAESGTL